MAAPRLSVVMSVYNGEPYLRAAVDGILRQTFADFEFVIVDDGSRDGTASLLADYAARDERIVLLTNATNIGYTRSLNKGLAAARGAYLARQDADDISLPERLACQVAYMDAHPAVGVAGTLAQVIDDSDRPLDRDHFPKALDNEAVQAQLLIGNCLCHGSVVIRRQHLEQVGDYDVDLEPTEDYDLWLRLAEVGQIVNLEARLYQYRVHAASVSTTRRPQQSFSRARALERALQRRHGAQPPPAYAANLAVRYLEAALAAYDAGQLQGARTCLARALALQPALLAGEAQLSDRLVDYAVHRSPEAGDAFIRGIFAQLLPPTARLARLRRRLLSDLHMREVFAGAQSGAHPRVDAHLWPALRHDPAWLLNRGVVAILARSLTRRARRPAQP
jgi:GT2 family glycosyltransferase